MLTKIIYSLDEFNHIKKTASMTFFVSSEQLSNEISALSEQLIAFQQGEQTPEIVEAIENYQTQIVFLQGL